MKIILTPMNPLRERKICTMEPKISPRWLSPRRVHPLTVHTPLLYSPIGLTKKKKISSTILFLSFYIYQPHRIINLTIIPTSPPIPSTDPMDSAPPPNPSYESDTDPPEPEKAERIEQAYAIWKKPNNKLSMRKIARQHDI